MSSRTCCVTNCSGGHPLHLFPNPKKNLELFRKWVREIDGHIVKLEDDFIHRNRRVCRKHFTGFSLYPKNRLSKMAVPTLFLKAATMEHRARGSVKKLSDMEMTMKTEVKAEATSTAHFETEMDFNHLKQEPGLVRTVKSEPALLVKEEILEDGNQAGNEQQYVQGTTTPAGTRGVNEDCGMSLGDFVNVKQELQYMDTGPTVLQYMDIRTYRINKNVSAGTGEHTSVDDSNKGTPCRGVKKQNLKDKLRAGNEQQCVQGTTTQTGTRGVNEDCDTSLSDFLSVKQELEYMDIGPTVLQHMDMHYTLNKNVSAGTGENRIVDDCNEAMPCSGVKKESLEDKLRASRKYSTQQMTEDDYDEAHVKSCLTHQMNLQQHGFKCDRTDPKPSTGNKVNQRKRRRNSMTSSVIAPPSYLTRDETAKTNKKPNDRDKGYSSKTATFAQSRDVTKQMRVPKGDKPHRCDTCDARFSHRYALSVHMRVHTGEKPYRCDTCDAKFADKSNLTAHMKVHTGEKPYMCHTCDAKFARKWYLNVHLRIHTGEKPYRCDTCDARFSHHRSLTVHMRIHTSDKPYRCDL